MLGTLLKETGVESGRCEWLLVVFHYHLLHAVVVVAVVGVVLSPQIFARIMHQSKFHQG
jgi:hypothetical protein